ncbi:MAG: hypothetical protein C0489_13660, partial [Candidatus Accumulibacter sp.]|nr:hypothetical protein [Accumulibacter sp.]
LAHDQFDNAARVRALGVGASLRAARLDSRRLGKRLGEVVGNKDMVEACRQVAARCGPADLAPLCARLASLVG